MTTPPLSSDRPAIPMPDTMKERILYAFTAFARMAANETEATLLVEVAQDCRTFTVVIGPSPAEERAAGEVVVEEDELGEELHVRAAHPTAHPMPEPVPPAPAPSPAPPPAPHAYPPFFSTRIHLPGRQDN